jgi:hypothetical protein
VQRLRQAFPFSPFPRYSFPGNAICVCVTMAIVRPSTFCTVVCHTEVVRPT